MSEPADKTRRRETIVEQYSHNEAEHGVVELERVVVVSIDESSAQYVINWAVDNFVRPDKDLVVLVHVRLIDTPLAPYVDASGYIEEMAEERKVESHKLLKSFASRLWHRKASDRTIHQVEGWLLTNYYLPDCLQGYIDDWWAKDWDHP